MSYQINTLVSSEKIVAPYEKRLSICPNPNGFSFSVTTTSNELLTYGDITHPKQDSLSEMIVLIKKIFTELHVQPNGYGMVEMVAKTDQFQWIPEHLYDGSQNRAYLEAMYSVPRQASVYSDFNDELNAYIVFTADSTVVSAFKVALPTMKIRCQHSKMVNSHIIDGGGLKSVLLIHVDEDQSDFATFCNRKLQMSNTYHTNSFDETIYHALNITKRFRLEDSSLKVLVCGEVDRQRFGLLQRFFQDVQLYYGKNLKMMTQEMKQIARYKEALILS